MYGRATVEYVFGGLGDVIRRVYWINENGEWNEGEIISKSFNIDDENNVGMLKIYIRLSGTGRMTKIVLQDDGLQNLIWSNTDIQVEGEMFLEYVLIMGFSDFEYGSNGGGVV